MQSFSKRRKTFNWFQERLSGGMQLHRERNDTSASVSLFKSCAQFSNHFSFISFCVFVVGGCAPHRQVAKGPLTDLVQRYLECPWDDSFNHRHSKLVS